MREKEGYEMRKTILSVMAAALVLAAAAGAFAWGGGYGGSGWDDCGPGFMMGPGGSGPDGDRDGRPGPRGGQFMRNAPAEIQSAMRELHRADLQIRLALTEDKVDVAKARAIFEKQLKLQEQVTRWRFEEMLKGATNPPKK
jgi:Spy/CpxP family protein refolding chaperone